MKNTLNFSVVTLFLKFLLFLISFLCNNAFLGLVFCLVLQTLSLKEAVLPEFPLPSLVLFLCAPPLISSFNGSTHTATLMIPSLLLLLPLLLSLLPLNLVSLFSLYLSAIYSFCCCYYCDCCSCHQKNFHGWFHHHNVGGGWRDYFALTTTKTVKSIST